MAADGTRATPAAVPGPGSAPAVSVIIATCDRPQLLLECVASILRNDFEDFEIIVVDQARERTLQAELARRFGDDRLVYVVLEEPNLSRARNVGVRHARGQILVFSDDDTEVEVGWLRAFVDAFDSADRPGIVGGRLDPMWLGPRPPWLPECKEYLLGVYNKYEGLTPMPGDDLPIGANFAVHRRVVQAVGVFDERVGPSYARRRGMIFGDDSLFCLRARQAQYPLYHQGAARAWHKMLPHKVSKAGFVRRSFWEGVTQVTVLHLAGSVRRDHWYPIVRLHAGEVSHWGRRLAHTLVRWRRRANPVSDVMEALSTIAHSAGVIRAALKLRSTGRLPW